MKNEEMTMNKEYFTMLFLSPSPYYDKLGEHKICTLDELKARVGEFLEYGYTMEKVYHNTKGTQVLIYDDSTWL